LDSREPEHIIINLKGQEGFKPGWGRSQFDTALQPMRRRMYSSDDEGDPPSPPLGTAVADATADMWQRTRRTRPKPPSPVWRGAGGDDGVDVKGENR